MPMNKMKTLHALEEEDRQEFDIEGSNTSNTNQQRVYFGHGWWCRGLAGGNRGIRRVFR